MTPGSVPTHQDVSHGTAGAGALPGRWMPRLILLVCSSALTILALESAARLYCQSDQSGARDDL
jgi:hypothetical protein